jgi:hypothetical protein
MYYSLPANTCCGRVHQTSKVTVQGRSFLYDVNSQTQTNRDTDRTTHKYIRKEWDMIIVTISKSMFLTVVF